MTNIEKRRLLDQEVVRNELLWEICDSDIPFLLDRIEQLEKQVKDMSVKQTSAPVDIADDGEVSCPACHTAIAGYYANYCEPCGQRLDRSKAVEFLVGD